MRVCVHPSPILQGVSGKVQTNIELSTGRTERTGRRRAVSVGRENERGEREQDRESKRNKEIGRLGKIKEVRQERNSGRATEQKEGHGECVGDMMHEDTSF